MRSMRSTRSHCLQLVPWRNSQKLKVWLEVLVQKSRKVGDTLRGEVNDFYDVEPAKLDSALLKICTKVETPEYSVPTHPTRSATSSPAGRKEKARKRSEEFCGKCPLCSKRHTWTRRDGEQWPSDRYLSCRRRSSTHWKLWGLGSRRQGISTCWVWLICMENHTSLGLQY